MGLTVPADGDHRLALRFGRSFACTDSLGDRPRGRTVDEPPEFLFCRHEQQAFPVDEAPAADTTTKYPSGVSAHNVGSIRGCSPASVFGA